MSFNKISLFSLLCFANCSLTIAMEITEQSPDTITAIKSSIDSKLKQLDLSILNHSERLKLAKEQKRKDKKIYNDYIAEETKRYNNCRHIIDNDRHLDYDNLEYLYRGNNYNFIMNNKHTKTNYLGNGHNVRKEDPRFIPGSRNIYNSLKKQLSESEVFYILCVANLQRCENYMDMEPQKATMYLSDVNARLQKYLDAIAKEEQK
jgi:hypothetical protein